MHTTPVARGSLDSRQGLLAELAEIDVEGWGGRRGERLLGYVRAHIVRPQVLGLGLRGPIAEQAEATAWEVAWETLSRPGIRDAASPWGFLWVAVRRAVLGEVVSSAHQSGVRSSWRAEQARHSGAGGGRRSTDPPVSLGTLVERGWEPVAPPMAAGYQLGPRLEAVVSALVAAGWNQHAAHAVVEGVAVTAVGDGKASTQAAGWRPLAARLQLPPWQVRRVTVLLLGAPGWPGLIERMTRHGHSVLADPGVAAALRSTAVSWWPPPPVAARRARPAQGTTSVAVAS